MLLLKLLEPLLKLLEPLLLLELLLELLLLVRDFLAAGPPRTLVSARSDTRLKKLD